MSKKRVSESQPQAVPAGPKGLTEDWLAVIIAFGLILLASIGLIGPKLLNITF